MSKAKLRIEWIDILRGFAIFLVLLGHNNPPFINYIYGFHMPLFFVISGYLYNDEQSLWVHLRHIFNRYVLTYIVLCIFNLFLYYVELLFVVGSIQLSSRTVLSNIKNILLVNERGMQGCFPLWYLAALSMSLAIFALIMTIKNGWVRTALVVIVSGTGFVLGQKGIYMPFRFSIAFVAVFFIGVGYLFRKYDVVAYFTNLNTYVKKMACLILMFALSVIVIGRNSADGMINMSIARYGNPCMFILGALLGTLILLFIFSEIGKRRNRFLNFIETAGRHTIFFIAFDESSNLLGGSLVDSLKLQHFWYTDFCLRLTVLLAYYLLFRLALKTLKSIPALI